MTSFESRQVTHPIRIDRLDGVHLAAELPKGWEGHFELERGNSAADDFIHGLEQAWHAESSWRRRWCGLARRGLPPWGRGLAALRTMTTSADLVDCLYLVRNSVSFDVAFSLDEARCTFVARRDGHMAVPSEISVLL